MIESLTLPLLLKAAPVLIPVTAKLAKHVFTTDSKLLGDLIELAIEKGEDKAKDKLEAALKQKPDVVLAWHQHVFIDYTGWVLGQLVQHLAQQPQFSAEKQQLEQLAEQAPEGWKTFVLKGSPGLSPVHQDVFLRQMAAALSRGEELPPIETVPFITFFNWHVRLSPALQERLATHLRTHFDNAIQLFLLSDYPKATQAYKKIILNGIDGLHASLKSLHNKTDVLHHRMDATVPVIVETHQLVKDGQNETNALLCQLLSASNANSAVSRLAAYNRSLLAAFRPYQELAIDNFAAAEQTSPDIWDIFVHPACAEEHLRPEEMDAAQREMPPRNPAVELLPLLAREDHRRTVLLGDPGMGKSTLIQALIAHLASGRALAGAPALTGLLPVPLILRDLVPLLPQDQVESWSWDALLDAFLCHYQRDEAALKLCDAFKDHLPEFRHHLRTDPKVFFLIDGLDEIGDLAKREQIVRCIQEGIRAVSKAARWLVTSRVIGYEQVPIDEALWEPNELIRLKEFADKRQRISVDLVRSLWRGYAQRWDEVAHEGYLDRLLPRLDKTSHASPFEESYHVHPGNAPRLLSGKDRLTIAQRLYLSPFDDRRQDAFTQRWFQHRHSTDYSKELMREVRAHHHDGVRIISRVPNLLSMINVLKRSGKPLPNGRAELYDMIVQAYLGGIDSAYRLRPVLGNTCPFDPPQRRFLLALLGAHMQQRRVSGGEGKIAKGKGGQTVDGRAAEGTILISRGKIADLLVPAIERMVAEKRVNSTHEAGALLDELLHHIASRSGLLIPRSSDALFGFTHLSFLEFFAAEWLGMEFDRRQRQLARHSEAQQEDDVQLTPAELEQLFPPHGPIQHTREDFKSLPALSAWHEPIIFLLETRKNDTPTLLRWLFPRLHAAAVQFETWNQKPETPWLPFESVQLAVKLAQDPEIPIAETTRQSWWRILWSAYLEWPHPPWRSVEDRAWPIAPLLLEAAALRREVLQALVSVLPQHPDRPLYLYECHQLTSSDLASLRSLDTLKELHLSGCIGLEDTASLAGLRQLQMLYLINCIGLKGAAAFQGLGALRGLKELLLSGCTGLEDTATLGDLRHLQTLLLSGCTGLKSAAAFLDLAKLKNLHWLDLEGCTGLEDTAMLADLRQLRTLDLGHCTGLKGAAAFRGLTGLAGLRMLNLTGCTGLDDTTLLALRQTLPASCRIYGPAGPEVKQES